MVTPHGCVSFAEAVQLIAGDCADAALRSAESDALTQALFDGAVQAKLLDAQTGAVFALPSRFWATPEAGEAKAGELCRATIGSGWTGLSPVRGHTFLLRADVERWAAARADAVAEYKANPQNAAGYGGRKKPGRPAIVGDRVEAAIEDLRRDGVDVHAMGEKALAKQLKARGVDASPRTVGRKKKGA